MPMYVYKCFDCGRRFEEISSVAAGEKQLNTPCTRCGGKVIRPISDNKSTVHLCGYAPEHPRYFRGMRGRR